MKELITEIKKKDKIQITAEIPVKHEKRLCGSIPVHKGHRAFKLNLLNNFVSEIQEDEFEKLDYKYAESKMPGILHKKIIRQDGCIYCTALNLKNAKKKFKRHIQKFIERN